MRPVSTLCFYLATVLILLSGTVCSQEFSTPDLSKRHRSGLFLAFGGQALLDVDYRYLVQSLQLEYQYSMKRKGPWMFHAYVQPQASLTRFNFEDDEPVDARGHEFGVALGFLAERTFSEDRFRFYTGVGSGPCFLSKGTHRQTEGVAFASSLFCGAAVRFSPDYEADLRAGYRHVSNAGLSQPNGGLNNSMFSVGVFRRF